MKGIYKSIFDNSMLAVALSGTLWWSYIFMRISVGRYHTFLVMEPNVLISIFEFGLAGFTSLYLIIKIIKNIKKVERNE